MGRRDQELRKMQARVDEWKAEIDLLEAKLAQAGAETRVELERELLALRKRRDDTMAKLEQLGAASGDALEDLQSGFERAVDELGEAVRRARARF